MGEGGFGCANRDGLSKSCRRRFFSKNFPKEINRHTANHDQQSGPGRRRLINEKYQKNHRCSDNVENGHNWITKRLVWALGVWSLPPQQEQTSDCENVKNQRGRNYVVDQVSIKIAVTSFCLDGARRHVDYSRNPLNYE